VAAEQHASTLPLIEILKTQVGQLSAHLTTLASCMATCSSASSTQPIKWALPGPMTMIDTLYDSHYESREKLAWEFARILNQEALAGACRRRYHSVRRTRLQCVLCEANDWGVATLERAVQGLKCETAVHICYAPHR